MTDTHRTLEKQVVESDDSEEIPFGPALRRAPGGRCPRHQPDEYDDGDWYCYRCGGLWSPTLADRLPRLWRRWWWTIPALLVAAFAAWRLL